MSQQMILPGLPSAISLRASGHGHTPCAAQDGRMTAPSGQDPVPASLSARQAKEKGLLTSGTCGPPSSVSSASAALTSFLASRLQALTALHGSTLLRKNSGGMSLQTTAQLAGWPTPRSVESGHGTGNPTRAFNRKARIEDTVFLAGWVTPSARNWKDTPGMATERPDGRNRTDQLPRQATTAYPCRLTVSGEMLTGSCAGMESGGQLNPGLSRWLMGLPQEWDDCGAMVTPSSRRRQKPS